MLMMLSLGTAAARADIVDDAVVAADRVPVYRMVYGAVADAAVMKNKEKISVTSK